MNIGEKNYLLFLEIIPEIKKYSYIKMKSSGYMDLNIDCLYKCSKSEIYRYSIAHNTVQNGDVMADPDMEINIDFDEKIIEARTFQNDFLGLFQDAENDISLISKLDVFLNLWLRNIKNQRFEISKFKIKE